MTDTYKYNVSKVGIKATSDIVAKVFCEIVTSKAVCSSLVKYILR